MSWVRTRLGDFSPFIYGKSLPKQLRTKSGDIEVFGSGGVVGKHDMALTTGPTIVVGRKGSVGKVYFSPDPCWPIDTTYFVEHEDPLLARYMYYTLKSAGLDRLNYDSAVPGLNRNHAHSIKLRVPSVGLQRQIATVLGTFDDLIENNRRRIEILEEMARLLYREWFVYFRFPGHEDVELVDSDLGPIPAGWKVAELESVAQFVSGNTKTKAAYVDKGYTAFSASGPDGKLETYDLEGHGIVMSVVGAHCGKTFRASGRWSSIANTLRILSLDHLSHAWLYLATADPRMWPRRGSAQPFVSINDARSVRVLVPHIKVRRRFEDLVRPLYQLVDKLVEQNAVLQEARDLLLPRLISGELDVSDLDLDLAAV